MGDVEGDVEIAISRGDVRLSKVGGNVRMDVSRSDLVRAADVKGRIDLQGRGSDVELENIAGQVTISGSFSGSLNFKNLAKPLQFEGTRGTELSAQAVPGRISMDLGEFTATDVTGPIRLVSRARDIKLEQFTQSVELETDRRRYRDDAGAAAGLDQARSGSGKIELLLPEKANFQLDATAERGDAVNDFGLADPEAIGRAQRDAQGQGGRRAEHQDYGQSRVDFGAQGRHDAERSAARHAEGQRSPAADAATGSEGAEGSAKSGCDVLGVSGQLRSRSVGPALAVLFLVNVLNFYDRQTLAAILEPLRHEFSLSDTQLGGLFTLFTVVFALAGLPLGRLADTRSRRGLLAGGIAVWTGLTGAAGLATVTPCCWGRGWGWGSAKPCALRRQRVGSATWCRRRTGACDGWVHDGGPGGDDAELGDQRAGRRRTGGGWR